MRQDTCEYSTDMAEGSPAKKSKTVKGQICNVSPLIDTQKPYFEASLQHESGCSKVTVFRPEEHMHFQNAEMLRSPVTLQDVIISPSKSNGTTQVFYTHNSKMSCVRNLGTFNNTQPAEPQDIQLSELLKLDIKPQKININVKIILEEFKGNNVVDGVNSEWDRRYLSETVYTIADTTGSISLTVWGEENISVGEWYKITNVSVNQFKGEPSLSTTRHTKISNIPSQGMAVPVKVPVETKKCEIIGVNLKKLFICYRKHELRDLIPSSPKVYCPSCKTHYKTTATIMKISGHLDLKLETGNVINASVEDEIIRSAVDVKPDASQDDIVQGLMFLPLMQMTICKNVIVKMEETTSHNNSGIVLVTQTGPAVVKPDDSVDFYSPPDLGLFSSQPQK